MQSNPQRGVRRQHRVKAKKKTFRQNDFNTIKTNEKSNDLKLATREQADKQSN